MDPQQIISLLPLKPEQLAIVPATLLIMKFLKDAPDIPTPKKWRPLMYFGVALLFNVGVDWVRGALDPKSLVAEQIATWITVLAARHVIDSMKKPQEFDPRDGRDGDPRRP